MHDETREEKPLGLFGILGAILYYLSFLPYLYCVFAAVMGIDVFFGFMDYSGTLYGLKAVIYSGMMLTVIPILPVCLLYQILFGTICLRVRPKSVRRPAAIYACIFAALIVIPCLIYWGREKIYVASNKPEVRAFLEDKYGEQFTGHCRIVLESMEDEEFKVYSPVLPDDVPFIVSRDRNTHEFDDHNDLMRGFAYYNEGFTEALNDYLDEIYGLPDNAHISVECSSVDFRDYSGDYTDLLRNAEYTIYSIDIEPETIDQESLEELTYEIWERYVPRFGRSVDECLTVYIYDGDTRVAEIQVLQASYADNGIPVGYIDAYENIDTPYEIEDELFYLV